MGPDDDDVEFPGDDCDDAHPEYHWDALAEWEDVVEHPDHIAAEEGPVVDPVVDAMGELPTVESEQHGRVKIFKSKRTGLRIARLSTVRHEQPGECLCIVYDLHKCKFMKSSKHFPDKLTLRRWMASGESPHVVRRAGAPTWLYGELLECKNTFVKTNHSFNRSAHFAGLSCEAFVVFGCHRQTR